MSRAYSQTTICLLTLMKLKGVGRARALRLIDQSVNESSLEACKDFLLYRVIQTGLTSAGEQELLDAWWRSEAELENGQEIGVQALAFHDSGYPARLTRVPDPPAVLFVKGQRQGLHASRGVAVVGTREPTEFGKKVAQRSGRISAEAGYAVVSGLAYGCDTHAHWGCVEARGVGVVVLAHGLDKVYPARNRDLADRLLEDGGCLTSEYPTGSRPLRAAFAERDRIQSGLADGVLVIETDVRGGTMHTVRAAHAQRRPVACVDHPERCRSASKTRGNRMLIDEGRALPVADGEALLGFLRRLNSEANSTVCSEIPERNRRGQTSFSF